jgi:hypothetical protein
MLNVYQMSDLWQFKDQLEDGRIKTLLNSVLFEYSEYIECGSVEDCKFRKELCSMSLEELGYKFNKIVKGLREEVEFIRQEANKPPKRGRAPKRSDNNA